MLHTRGIQPVPVEQLQAYVHGRHALPPGQLHDPLYDAPLTAVAYWLLREPVGVGR